MQKKKTKQVFLVGKVVEKAVCSNKVNKKQFYSTKIIVSSSNTSSTSVYSA